MSTIACCSLRSAVCVPPENGSHSTAVVEYNLYLEGDLVIYQCDPGYEHPDPVSRECTANGTWSGNASRCTGDEIKPRIFFCLHR